MAQRYRQEVGRLREAFNHPEHRTEAATLLRSLVDKVVLTPNGSKKPLTIDLHGDLAGILTIATGRQKRIPESDMLIQQIRRLECLAEGAAEKQLELVAGAGFALFLQYRHTSA